MSTSQISDVLLFSKISLVIEILSDTYLYPSLKLQGFWHLCFCFGTVVHT